MSLTGLIVSDEETGERGPNASLPLPPGLPGLAEERQPRLKQHPPLVRPAFPFRHPRRKQCVVQHPPELTLQGQVPQFL